jgi:hypothetical protein
LKGEIMPVKMWKHKCLNTGEEHSTGTPDDYCSCGGEYNYDGWHKTTFEKMAWYQKTHGLKPIGIKPTGSHRGYNRSYTDEVFSGSTKPCPDCSGRGLHDIGNGHSYAVCSTCEGAGYLLIISEEERQILRKRVLEKYPEAEAPSDISNPTTGVILHDLEDGLMIVED